MDGKDKIIVVHPGRQHSFHLADALKKNGTLQYYVTTVYDKTISLTHFVGFFLRGDDKKRFTNRKSDVFDENVIQYYELLGLLVIFLNRNEKTKKLGNKIDGYIHNKIYQKTIKLAKKSKADAIVFYGGLRKNHFDLIKKEIPNVKIVVDVPIVTNRFLRETADKDILLTGDDRIKIEQPSLWNTSSDANTSVWCRNADAFLVGSTVVKRSIMMFGADEDKIHVVPYGVDVSRFYCKTYHAVEKVKFIFVGTVYRRKGIHHLLTAFAELNPDDAELYLVGSYSKNDPYYEEYSQKSNIHFEGQLTQDKVAEMYRMADVFILPTLGEGMAQVGIEAMCCGLPIICTENSGVNDLVTNEKEGIVIPVSDTKAVKNAMEWFVLNKDKISEMGMNAYQKAHRYTWDYYEGNVVEAIRSVTE